MCAWPLRGGRVELPSSQGKGDRQVEVQVAGTVMTPRNRVNRLGLLRMNGRTVNARSRPQSLTVSFSYEAESSSPSVAEASDGAISTIHPSPYGSALTSSGREDSASFRATTSPA